MPSSKYIDKSNDYIPMNNTPIPRVFKKDNVVSFEQWCDQNEEHLYDIYTMLQDACSRSGRHVFDSQTCGFASFCKIAYDNSYKYKKHDTNYDTEEIDDTVVF